MACPSFLKRTMRRRLRYKTIGPSGAEIGNVNWFAYFDGENNYLSFDETTIPSGAFTISINGVFLNADGWIVTDKDASVSPSSGRVILYNKNLYVEDVIVMTFTDAELGVLTNRLPHYVEVGRDAEGTWFFNIDNSSKGTSIAKENRDLTFDSFGRPYSGTTSVPYLNAYVWDLKISDTYHFPLRDGYSQSGTAKELIQDKDGTYINFAESDFVKQLPDFYGDASINNAQLTINDQPVRIMLGA